MKNKNKKINESITESAISPLSYIIFIDAATSIENSRGYLKMMFTDQPPSSIKTWFRQRHHKNCPLCRSNWSDFNVYINGVEPEPVDFEETNIPEILDPSTST